MVITHRTTSTDYYALAAGPWREPTITVGDGEFKPFYKVLVKYMCLYGLTMGLAEGESSDYKLTFSHAYFHECILADFYQLFKTVIHFIVSTFQRFTIFIVIAAEYEGMLQPCIRKEESFWQPKTLLDAVDTTFIAPEV